jgi:predicted membrane channel-forming protein YqfA (hemolysin III family)
LLQSNWVAATGTPLRLQRHGVWQAVGVALFVLLSPVYHLRVSPHMTVWKLPMYSAAILQLLVHAIFWKLLNGQVADAARRLRRLLHDRVR